MKTMVGLLGSRWKRREGPSVAAKGFMVEGLVVCVGFRELDGGF